MATNADGPICSVCRWRPVKARERCGSCYEYLRRRGRDRAQERILAEGQELLEAQLFEEAQGPMLREARRRAERELDVTCRRP